MKYLFFSVLAFLFFASFQATDNDTTTEVAPLPENRIEVIDFHSTHRCKTCLKIEDNTKTLLKTTFKKEMAARRVVFKSINVDATENTAMAARFEAAGTALFINVVRGGEEEHIDLTNFAFMKAFDEDEFKAELKAKINEQLKTL